jgi:hypothetical protein
MYEKELQGLKVEQVVIYAKLVGYNLGKIENSRVDQLKLEIFF